MDGFSVDSAAFVSAVDEDVARGERIPAELFLGTDDSSGCGPISSETSLKLRDLRLFVDEDRGDRGEIADFFFFFEEDEDDEEDEEEDDEEDEEDEEEDEEGDPHRLGSVGKGSDLV